MASEFVGTFAEHGTI